MATYKGGKLADGTPLNVAVYNAYRNAGLSHNQALAVTAEVGRENSFNANILFGNHTDPARDKNGKKIRNLGMLSWNQGRDNMLEGFLKQNGVMKNGVMEQTQENLNAQARFSVREMKSKKYAGKLKNFLNNPNASPDSYAKDLGRHYIAWAYGQDTIKAQGGGRKPFDWRANDNRRRGYLNTLSGMLGGSSYEPSESQAPKPLGTDWNAFKSKLEGGKPQQAMKPLGNNWDAFKNDIEGDSTTPQAKPLGTDWSAFKSSIDGEQPMPQPEPLGTDWSVFKNSLEGQSEPKPETLQPLGTNWDSFKQSVEEQPNIIGGNYGSRI